MSSDAFVVTFTFLWAQYAIMNAEWEVIFSCSISDVSGWILIVFYLDSTLIVSGEPYSDAYIGSVGTPQNLSDLPKAADCRK